MFDNSIRAFIAIELPEEVKKALTEAQSRLKKAGPIPAKWVDADGLHLTLKFLGNISPPKAGEVIAAIEKAAQSIPSFQLEVKGLGAFPNLRRVQVVWVGVGGDLGRLGELQQRLDAGLAETGFAPEARSFTPHLTLARIREFATAEERQKLGELIAATEFTAPGFAVRSIDLMRSQLTREGAIYTRLQAVGLSTD